MIAILNGNYLQAGAGAEVESEEGLSVLLSPKFINNLFILKGARLHILIAIFKRINKLRWAYPTIETISQETLYSPAEVVNTLAEFKHIEMEGVKFLHAVPVRRGGRFANNGYLVFPTKDEIEQYSGGYFRGSVPGDPEHVGFYKNR